MRKLIALAIVLNVALAPVLFGLRDTSAQPTDPPPSLSVWRVTVKSPEDVTRLTTDGWDVLEARGSDYLLVLGDSAVVDQLRASGFTVTLDHTLSSVISPLTYYNGYRTVAEHYQHLNAIEALHPTLVKLVDYGDSWGKLNARPIQNDLIAICITKLRPGDCALNPNTDKPRFLLMAAIHSRELTTAEVAWRWIDHLTTEYGSDPEVTALLDYNELWVIPLANPDGRAKVEQGGSSPYTQRKNLNNSAGTCSDPPSDFSQFGIDLNRNASFQWGVSGSSTSACSLTYRGPSAASEPEEAALESLMTNLFRDQRGPLATDAAPITTTGSFISMHSYSELVLFPYGWTECFGIACPVNKQSPNDAGLRSMGFRMSHYNGYDTGQPSELLYAASGTTDDWAYGVLGVAGFTFEIGPQFGACGGFFPAYSCVNSTFWPENRDALMYAAKAARQPYALALGPTPISPTLNLPSINPGTPVTLTVTLHDDAYGNAGVGRPAAQNVTAAEVYVDVPWWASGAPLAMTAQDGAFDSASEVVQVMLNTAGWSAGRHTLFVRGRDAAGNWGVFGAAFVDVDVPQWGVRLTPLTAHGFASAPGQMLTYTLTLSNTGAFSDLYNVSLAGNGWPTNAPSIVTLASQQSQPVTVTVTVPLTATLGASDVVTLTAMSTGESGVSASSTITTTFAHQLYLPLIQRGD